MPAPKAAGPNSTRIFFTPGVRHGSRRRGIMPARRSATVSSRSWATPPRLTPQASAWPAPISGEARATRAAAISAMLSRIGAPAKAANRPEEVSMPPNRAVSEISSR